MGASHSLKCLTGSSEDTPQEHRPRTPLYRAINRRTTNKYTLEGRVFIKNNPVRSGAIHCASYTRKPL